jgi:hypothetical protein
MILNDIGAVVEGASLRRIGTYLKQERLFDSLDQVKQYFKSVHAPFGLSDSQWDELIPHSVRQQDGQFRLHYDPRIADNFDPVNATDISLWDQFLAVPCQVLLLRGEHSDLLAQQVAEEMAQKKSARLVVVKNVSELRCCNR